MAATKAPADPSFAAAFKEHTGNLHLWQKNLIQQVEAMLPEPDQKVLPDIHYVYWLLEQNLDYVYDLAMAEMHDPQMAGQDAREFAMHVQAVLLVALATGWCIVNEGMEHMACNV
jgi:hypothetical protein